jgi:5-methyltetrahydropteroyltriglutamate--homocysteine methyltransferase
VDVILPTTLVGSYPQPDWLIDRRQLAADMPPRVRRASLWRVPPEHLEQAQDDATVLAILDQERAGIDIVSDGEMRRESYSNRFATALDGLDLDRPGSVVSRSGATVEVPRVVGRIRRRQPVGVRDVRFLKEHTRRAVKITVPGPFTMSQQAQDEFYGSEAALAFDYAEAVRAEVRDLFEAGADVVQLDEPYMQARPEKARQFGVEALARALDGVSGTTAVHICFGYASLVKGRPGRYAFLGELAGRPFGRCRSKRRRRTSTAPCSPSSRARRSCSASSTSRRPTSSRRRPWRPASAARSRTCRPSGSSLHRTAG